MDKQLRIYDPLATKEYAAALEIGTAVIEQIKLEPWALWDIDKEKPTEDLVKGLLEHGRFFIVYEGDTSIGVVLFYNIFSEGCWAGVWIPPEARGTLALSKVIFTAFSYALDLGIKKINGWAAQDNVRAVNIAEKLGAVRVFEKEEVCNGKTQVVIAYEYDLATFKEHLLAAKQTLVEKTDGG